MTTELYDKLTAIHNKVLKSFEYETDKEQYGTDEKWVMPDDAFKGMVAIIGDCEDFALACRKLCRDASIQTRLVICTLEGEGHCVLEADGWILCNNQNSVVPRDILEESGYVWYYISGYNSGDDWHLIKG